MAKQFRVSVTSPSFSNDATLTRKLTKHFPNAELNINGKHFSSNELVSYLADTTHAIIGTDKLTSEILEQLPNLKMISKYGVGLDNIDLEYCKNNGIKIGWTGGTNKLSVAEMTLGFMLSLIRNLYSTSIQLKDNVWNKSGGTQLSGKTIGIIGIGHIGREVIRLLQPFRCRIIINDIIDLSEVSNKYSIEEVSKEVIFKEADIITVHTPLTDQTQNLINQKTLSMMKSSSFVINTARGGIINENDLLNALKEKEISGAAVDVYETEPAIKNELLSLPNLFCTPHIGGNSKEAIRAMGASAIIHLVNELKR